MVKITPSPITEVVVHEFVKVEKDDLLRSRITPAGNMPLYWCNGILFTFNSLPFTRDVVKDYLAGKVHWAEVQFTKMDKYAPILELEDSNYTGQQKVRIINTSISALHKDLTAFLKSKM